MQRFFPVMIFIGALCIPFQLDGAIGGGGLCKGTTGPLNCTALNGANCCNVPGAYVCAPEGSRTRIVCGTKVYTCKAGNKCNANCCGEKPQANGCCTNN